MRIRGSAMLTVARPLKTTEGKLSAGPRWQVRHSFTGRRFAFAYAQVTGECKNAMMSYLRCIKKVKGVNEDECRMLAKSYLTCRMDR
jgi:hypothetical protein